MRSHGIALLLSSASVAALVLADSTASAHALPGGGHFAEGRGSLSRDGGRLTVEQDSQTAIIDWKRFSVGKKNGVAFDNGHGATLNIVQGGNISRIAGSLQSSGSVYLINRAGVVIGKSGRVDTQGSFAASGRNADADSFGGGGRRLRLTGAAKGNVINRGAIASGASVTLYGRATRAGSIAAQSHVETSGEHVRLHGASVSARNWLIDPRNLSVGGQAAHAIEASLDAGTDVTLKTTATNASGPGKKSYGDGDITISARIEWTSDATLKLDAWHSIYIAKPIRLYGAGGLTLLTARGGSGDYIFKNGSRVAFKDVIAGDTQGSLRINGDDYTLANSISQLASDISGNVNADGNYALADNYDASPDGTYTQAPITTFGGTFEGLGNEFSHLTIHSSSSAGLFESSDGLVRDIGIISAHVVCFGRCGILVGSSDGSIAYSHVGGSISAGGEVGALVGDLINGSVDHAYSTASVIAGDSFAVGGLVGWAQSSIISYAHASGAITAGNGNGLSAGGLVGVEGDSSGARAHDPAIIYSYATAAVTVGDGNSQGNISAGGLVGSQTRDASVSYSYATGDVKGGNLSNVGGLIGRGASISSSYATGNVTAGDSSNAGGLLGSTCRNCESTVKISNAYATGTATASDNSAVGGFAGANFGAAFSSSYAIGHVTGGVSSVRGGFVGELDAGTCTDCYWDIRTSGIGKHHGAGNIRDATGIRGKTTPRFQSALLPGFSSFVWILDPNVNNGFPFLKSLKDSY